MEISVNVNGTVTGKYRTAVGQPTNFEEFEITGFAAGDIISFIANFGKYGSITAWTGQHRETTMFVFFMNSRYKITCTGFAQET